MTQEIEKKYLLRENGINYATAAAPRNLFPGRGQKIKQGYLLPEDLEKICAELHHTPEFKAEEIRLRQKGLDFYLTLKGEGTLQRNEEERAVSQSFFERHWPKTEGRRVEKIRLSVPHGKYLAEIDFYTDRDLIIAEIEVPTLEEAAQLLPLGKDVTEDKRYKNKNLALANRTQQLKGGTK